VIIELSHTVCRNLAYIVKSHKISRIVLRYCPRTHILIRPFLYIDCDVKWKLFPRRWEVFHRNIFCVESRPWCKVLNSQSMLIVKTTKASRAAVLVVPNQQVVCRLLLVASKPDPCNKIYHLRYLDRGGKEEASITKKFTLRRRQPYQKVKTNIHTKSS
jgi:hypothetical protein